MQVPDSRRKTELKVAGLGEKQLVIALRATAVQLHSKVLLTFPKLLDCGGYEFLRCLPNSRSLVGIHTPNGGHTPQTLKDDVGNARIYVRPLQKDLPMTEENPLPDPGPGTPNEVC